MNQNVSDTLNKAADLIEERGWETGQGLEGGIMAAIGMRFPNNEGESTDERHFVGLFTCPAYIAVSERTSAAEVVEVLRGDAA
jgi:hypothetical protein